MWERYWSEGEGRGEDVVGDGSKEHVREGEDVEVESKERVGGMGKDVGGRGLEQGRCWVLGGGILV